MKNSQTDSGIIEAYIPPSQSLPEITFKGTVLALILAMVLAAANTYLGLKVGMTVTGSIPAAIVSMALLRFFTQHNILENNIVQTAASAGEVLASGTIFTLPALLIIQYWHGFHYWETLMIILTGGLLGVFFSIPLRRTFIYEPTLKFPEGVAIGNVLKLSSEVGGHIRFLVQGTALGGLIALSQNALRILSDSTFYWVKTSSTIIGFGIGFDAAVMGAGYIVGIQVGLSVLIGAIIGWLIGIPIVGIIYGLPENTSLQETAMYLWSNHIRYVGVGTMLVGGIYSIFKLIKPIFLGLKSSMHALRLRKQSGHDAILRTERDIPINYVFWATGLLGFCVIFIFNYFLSNEHLNEISSGFRWFISIFNCIYLLTAGFIFSAICCYLSGLVGSSSNPISGLILAAILAISLMLLPIFSLELTFMESDTLKSVVAISIIVAAFIGTSSAIGQDNLQDLKAGQVVGATPWKQQVMLMLGVFSAAFIIPPVLELLYNAYGIGGVFPREGMDAQQMLAAPQAALMASIAKGVFGQNLPWGTIFIGACIAILFIIIDEFINKYNYRLPVLAVGIGIYLPLSASIPLTIGGIASYLVQRKLSKMYGIKNNKYQMALQKGISIACGLVAGASIMGVLLAIPAVILQSTDALSLVSANFAPIAEALTAIVTVLLFVWIYKISTAKN